MFPALPSEYVQDVSEEPSLFEADKFLEDLLVDCVPLEVNNQGSTTDDNKTAKKRQRSKDHGNKNYDEASSNKKVMHRDIERQRRQEMSGLYASLRSLLPLEYIKGKRSTSDHMNQAVNYIRHMQKKIEETKVRRDNLMKKLLSTHEDPRSNVSTDSANSFSLKVNMSIDGSVEVLISSSLDNKEAFPLSRVIADLLARGLNVISCVSTKNGECSQLHKIQIQENDPTSIDVSALQERLVNVIKHA